MACFYSPLLDRAEWGQGGRHGGSNRAPGQQISVNAPQLCPRTSLNQSLMFAVKEREFNIYVYVQIYLIFFGHGDNQNNSKHTFTHVSSSYEWFYGMFSFVCVRVWPCQKLYSIEWKVYWCLFFLLIIWIWLFSVHVNEFVWTWEHHLAHHINGQIQQTPSVTLIPGIQHSQQISYVISAVLRPIPTEILSIN